MGGILNALLNTFRSWMQDVQQQRLAFLATARNATHFHCHVDGNGSTLPLQPIQPPEGEAKLTVPQIDGSQNGVGENIIRKGTATDAERIANNVRVGAVIDNEHERPTIRARARISVIETTLKLLNHNVRWWRNKVLPVWI